MIRSLWIAKTGLEAQQLNMDVISNNLANVNTNGFKRQRAVFRICSIRTCVSRARSQPSKIRCRAACSWVPACVLFPPNACILRAA